ncbi:baseplate wedge subunit [Klebsiella phage CPRSB]|nr:baseplate wedge subunit [Klebsiella phage CPRSB]
MAKVSNDKGQTWYYYKALNDRVGNPVSRTVAYQSANTTYVLGYDRIFYGARQQIFVGLLMKFVFLLMM